jgi:hypothetical protein
MYTRICKLFLLAVCYQVILVACCQEPLLPFSVHSGIMLSNVQVADSFMTSDVFLDDRVELDAEDFALHLEIEYEFVAASTLPSFISTSYAFSCPMDGEQGLKSPVVAIEVTANQDLLGVTAGSPLNDLMTYGPLSSSRVIGNPGPSSLAQLIQEMNFGAWWQSIWLLQFNQDFSTPDFVKFHIKITYEDGSVEERETEEVKFK